MYVGIIRTARAQTLTNNDDDNNNDNDNQKEHWNLEKWF